MYKLLIVDDEELEREGMAEFIPWEQYGIELIGTAWNGIDGLEKIYSLHPDIVLTDIKMPVMNGIELIKKAKERFPELEFVVLSGYGEYEFTSQAMEEGIRYYILKPCDEDRICKVIEKVKQDIAEKRRTNRIYCAVKELFTGSEEEKKNREENDKKFAEDNQEYFRILADAVFDKEEQILFELYLLYCKMEYLNYTMPQKKAVYQVIYNILNSVEKELPKTCETDMEVLEYIIRDSIIAKLKEKELQRFWEIKLQIWLHLSSQELSIKYLAKEILYMNEDYFGRLFQRYQKEKFSAYVLDQRLEIAKRLISYDRKMKVSEVVALVGFPEDGQYFSRVFKKKVGISPSEYREKQIISLG